MSAILTGALAVSLLLAGCSSNPSSTPTSSADTTATLAPTTTTTPPTTTTSTLPTTTTTLDDDGVVEALIGYITDPLFTALVDIEVAVSFEDGEFTGTGEGELQGEDGHFTMKFPGLPANETISLAGRSYERSGDGPWVVDEEAENPFAEPTDPGSAPVADLELIALLKTIGELEHQGTVQIDDFLLHRIGLPEDVNADSLAFGFEPDDEIRDVSFLATSRGVPYQLELQVESASDDDTSVSMTLVWRFVEVGVPVLITPPDQVWLTYTSDDVGYSIAHPRAWEVEEFRDGENYTEDRFYGLQGEELAVFVSEIDPPGRVPLNTWLDGFRSGAEADGMDVGTAEVYEVGEFPARMLTYSVSDDRGSYSAIYVVSQTDLETIYEFIVFNSNEEETRALLDDFLSTFTPSS